MAGRTPAEAVQNYLDPLQKVISCVTNSVLSVRGGYHVSPDPHPLALASGDPVSISRNPQISLSVLQNYRIVEYIGSGGAWDVRVVSYYYSLEDAEGGEVLYHWHPQGTSAVTFPHLHVGTGGQLGSRKIDDAHFPTGRVPLEDVLRLAITDFGVRRLRNDWREVLEAPDSRQAANEE